MELTLSEIWIYPVKSLGGIRVEKALVLNKGLQYDRRWMLIDHGGTAMTQREYPEMALFKPVISNGELHISFVGQPVQASSIKVNITAPVLSRSITARVWDDQVEVYEVSRQASDWFSANLKTDCTFVTFPEKNPRLVDPDYSISGDHVSLADAYPFLIIGQSSLDDLNQRLEQPLPMNRFRPNFVFTGGTPFLEDTWKNLSIGSVRFVAVKKSARCVLTTVDQGTAVKGPEPIRTLSTYRRAGNKIYFGNNMIAIGRGEVSVGDRIIPG